MTRNREPVQPEAGDWIVCTRKNTGANAQSLGGPWSVAKLTTRGVSGWNANANHSGNLMFVMDTDIARVCLSRGEAIDLVDKLTAAQEQYTAERIALKPKFEQRIRDLLNT